MADRQVRILQVNAWDVGGGAASVAWNLFTGYRARGLDSWLAVGQKYSRDADVLQIPPNHEFYSRWSRFWARIHRRIEQLDGRERLIEPMSRLALGLAEPQRVLDYVRGIEDFNYPGSAQLLSLPPRRPTIVHAHNLHDGYFDLRILPWLSRQVPLVLTLHDAWLLSGHCAHSLGCERWKAGCGHCPDLTIPPAIRRDATRHNWLRKRDIYSECRLHVATPSQWLMRKVEQSMLAPAIADARVIPNGVDLDVFRPGDRRVARSVLRLPQDAGILLFTANTIRDNAWKDYGTMRDAIARTAEHLPGQRIVFVALGDEAPAERIGRAEVHFVSYQRSEDVVARYYQAADVYVHAARADTFPTSVLEAQACGTPVVATAVGGIPEQVEDGRSGFLVPPRDARALASRLVRLLTDEAHSRQMGAYAADVVRQHFDLRRQVDTYLDWYRELLSSDGEMEERTRHAMSPIA